MRGDPFLTRAPEASNYDSVPSTWTQREHLVTREVALLIFAPWLLYVLLLTAFALPPPGWFWRFVAASALALGFFCAGASYELQKRHASPLYKLLTVMMLMSCLAAPLVGHHIFVTEMSSYWMHQKGVTYRDVRPSKSPDAYQDAGILDFAADARLDLRRSLGVRPEGSSTYCVAPVIDAAEPASPKYFAAGENCCEPRRSFLCGDAAKPGARTGVVLPSSSFHAERWQHFHAAARQAAEVYGWQLPERPIFVRWFEDAEAVQSELLHRGMVEVFLQSFVGLCGFAIMGMWLHWSLTFYVREMEKKKKSSRHTGSSCC